MIKPQRIGGVREALRAADAGGVPAIASSALETSVGLAAVVALAASLPDSPYAHGAGTALLLESDVVATRSFRSMAGSYSVPTPCRRATPRRGMTEPTEGDIALCVRHALLDGLVAGGVTHMCMTPGSRSTPIALAAAGIRRSRCMSTWMSGHPPSSGSGSRLRQVNRWRCSAHRHRRRKSPPGGGGSLPRAGADHRDDGRPPTGAARVSAPIRRSTSRICSASYVKWFCDTGVPVYGVQERHRRLSAGRDATQHARRFRRQARYT